MASLDDMKKAKSANKKGNNTDVELATRMTIKMMEEGGGLKVLRDALNQSQEPAVVIGQFLAQLVGQLAEQLKTELEIDPRIFLAKGGWLEKILDYIEKQFNYPEEFSEEVYAEVLEVIKAAAIGSVKGQAQPEAPQGGGLQGQAPAPAPAAPQAAPPQGGLGG